MSEPMSCQEVREHAAEFALGTLDAATARRVREHLPTCPDAHVEVAELGGVLPYLADSLEPVAPRPELRGAVLRAARAARPIAPLPGPDDTRPAQPPSGARGWLAPLFAPRPSWVTVGAAGLALGLAVTSAALFGELERSRSTADLLRRAVVAAAEPGSRIARLEGTAEAPGVHGLAVIAADGGALVVEGLPPAPAGAYYEAWFIVAELPTSAGRLEVDAGGLAVLGDLSRDSRVDVMAVTLEPTDGGAGPDGPIYASGPVSESAS